MKTKPAKASGKKLITRYIQNLNPEMAKIIERIRQIVLDTDPNIGEQIKWNNPCFYYTGPMQPFDPKDYKDIIIVMNLYKGRIMLVLPSGARIDDKTGLLQGDYKDGRRTIVFLDEADVDSKEKKLQLVIKSWIISVDK